MEIIEQSRAYYYENKISKELKNIENKSSCDANSIASILEEMELDIDVISTLKNKIEIILEITMFFYIF